MDSPDPPVDAQQALAVYAESLAVGKRVAVFGDASLGIAARLADLGARTVHVWDPDFDRARVESSRAPRGVVVRALLDDDIEVRDGAFDLAIVADLGLFGEAETLLDRIRRLVGDAGAALVSAAPRTFDYYELFDLVAGQFEDVRMIAQLPFYGVALAELGDENDSPAVTVDTQLAETDRAPQSFVALASQSGVRLDPYAIFELPSPPREAPPEERDNDEDRREQARVHAVDRQALSGALVEAGVRIDALEAQIQELQAHLAAALQVARAAEPLEEALRESASRLVELEQALGVRGRQIADLANEAESLRAALQSSRHAATLVESLGLRAERAEAAFAAAQSELRAAADAYASEHGRFEEALRERAQAIRLFESELARRERMVRDLVAALEEAGARPPSTAEEAPHAPPPPEARFPEREALVDENARLRAKLDELSLELARLVGEQEAAAWSVAELERKLAQRHLPATQAEPPAPAPSSPAPPLSAELERRLGDALDELNVLRLALAQEHEARVRAESSDELARAREEIQRQAVLLEQLGVPPV